MSSLHEIEDNRAYSKNHNQFIYTYDIMNEGDSEETTVSGTQVDSTAVNLLQIIMIIIMIIIIIIIIMVSMHAVKDTTRTTHQHQNQMERLIVPIPSKEMVLTNR